MQKLFFLFLAVLFPLQLIWPGIPQNFYVATTGSDSNSGTIDLPWKTIQKAASSATPGSTVFVRGGVYNEAVTIAVSGNASDGPITFCNYPNESPIIDGTGLTVPSSVNGLILIANKSYITVQGFELRNYKTSTKNLVPVGIYISGTGDHIQLLQNKIHAIEHNGTSSSGTDAHGIAVYGTSGTKSINNVLIDRNELYALKLGSSESLVVNGNVELFRITNNIVHDNNNIGIDAIGFEGTASANDQARNGLISGNTVYNIDSYGNVAYGSDRSADGIYVDGGKDIVIEKNTVHNANIGIELASEHSGKSTSNITMRSNFVYLCDIAGIAIGGYDTKRGSTENCKIVNNTLFQNDRLKNGNGEFYVQYDTRNNVFKNNIIWTNSQNIFISNAYTQNTGNVVDNNLYFSASGANDGTWEWKKVTYSTFAAYKTGTGNDANAKFTDPLIINSTTPDLHLKAGSPAIDAGAVVDSIGTLDIDGEARVNKVPDIGADEYWLASGFGTQLHKAPAQFELAQNYPNPFNPSTVITYHVAIAGKITLKVFDICGTEVATLVDKEQRAGSYSVKFNGSGLASGMYIVKLGVGNYSIAEKMILAK